MADETKRQPRDPVAELMEAAECYAIGHPCSDAGRCHCSLRLDAAIRAVKEMKR
jgi:hypothetical protein